MCIAIACIAIKRKIKIWIWINSVDMEENFFVELNKYCTVY